MIALRKLAEELDIVIPISFFEKDGPRYYNSVAIADAGGEILGVYRKSHIPDGPGYQEKYYFRPGDTGFKAWKTKHGMIGVGICWDQWYPEAARAMVLAGRRAPALSDGHRLRALRPHPRYPQAMAARDAGPRGSERRAGRRREPHRASRRTTARTRPITAIPSSPTIWASLSRASAPRRKAC